MPSEDAPRARAWLEDDAQHYGYELDLTSDPKELWFGIYELLSVEWKNELIAAPINTILANEDVSTEERAVLEAVRASGVIVPGELFIESIDTTERLYIDDSLREARAVTYRVNVRTEGWRAPLITIMDGEVTQ